MLPPSYNQESKPRWIQKTYQAENFKTVLSPGEGMFTEGTRDFNCICNICLQKKKRQRANSEGVLFYLCANVCLDVFQMFEEQPGPGTNKRRKRRHPLLLRAHHTPGGLLGLRVTTT